MRKEEKEKISSHLGKLKNSESDLFSTQMNGKVRDAMFTPKTYLHDDTKCLGVSDMLQQCIVRERYSRQALEPAE